jgi:hypothetical protein
VAAARRATDSAGEHFIIKGFLTGLTGLTGFGGGGIRREGHEKFFEIILLHVPPV